MLTELETALLDQAIKVIKAFNAPAKGAERDYGALKSMMEYNVVLKRVLHPDSIEGASDVMWFLDNHMLSRKAHLENWDSTLISSADTGEVSGTGDYYDDNNKTITPIFFALGFVQNDVTKSWSLINSHATPAGPTVQAQSVAQGKVQPIPRWLVHQLNEREQEDAKKVWKEKYQENIEAMLNK